MNLPPPMPFVIQASPDARPLLQEALRRTEDTLADLKGILESEGLYAPDGTLGIDDGSISVHFSEDSKQVDIRDTSNDIPF